MTRENKIWEWLLLFGSESFPVQEHGDFYTWNCNFSCFVWVENSL